MPKISASSLSLGAIRIAGFGPFWTTDLLNNPIDLTSSVTTTVHASVVTIAEGATGAVNAGEAITYSIRYENVDHVGSNRAPLAAPAPFFRPGGLTTK